MKRGYFAIKGILMGAIVCLLEEREKGGLEVLIYVVKGWFNQG